MCNLYLKQISFLSIQTLHPQDRYKKGLNAMNKKGADQPAHPRRLICVHVSRFMERVSKLASSDASLCSESSFVGNPKDMFNRDKVLLLAE